LSILAVAIGTHPAEDRANDVAFLPIFQDERDAGIPAFRVPQIPLEEANSAVCVFA